MSEMSIWDAYGFSVLAPIPLWLFISLIIAVTTQPDKSSDIWNRWGIVFFLLFIIVSVLFFVMRWIN